MAAEYLLKKKKKKPICTNQDGNICRATPTVLQQAAPFLAALKHDKHFWKVQHGNIGWT